MKLIDTTCPKCGAALTIDHDSAHARCEYCGAVLLIDDEVQHLQYDNAEEAGYLFEKGRQRAQAEMGTSDYHLDLSSPAPQRRKNTVWWVLGWLFIFPIPLTILMLRNRKLDKRLRYGIIAAAWIVYLLIGFSGGSDTSSADRSDLTPSSADVSVSDTVSTADFYAP